MQSLHPLCDGYAALLREDAGGDHMLDGANAILRWDIVSEAKTSKRPLVRDACPVFVDACEQADVVIEVHRYAGFRRLQQPFRVGFDNLDAKFPALPGCQCVCFVEYGFEHDHLGYVARYEFKDAAPALVVVCEHICVRDKNRRRYRH